MAAERAHSDVWASSFATTVRDGRLRGVAVLPASGPSVPGAEVPPVALGLRRWTPNVGRNVAPYLEMSARPRGDVVPWFRVCGSPASRQPLGDGLHGTELIEWVGVDRDLHGPIVDDPCRGDLRGE